MSHNQRKKSREITINAYSQAFISLLFSLISYKIHRKPVKKSQQAIGCSMAKHRPNKKKTPRPYVNVLIKQATELGIIKHYGLYEDKHWYEVTDAYRDMFFKIEAHFKELAWSLVSSLHSGCVDSIENLTLYSSYLLTLLNKLSKKDSLQGKSVRKAFLFETDPDLRLRSGREEYEYLMEKYGVPFVPEYDNGLGNREAMKIFNTELFELDVAECELLLSL